MSLMMTQMNKADDANTRLALQLRAVEVGRAMHVTHTQMRAHKYNTGTHPHTWALTQLEGRCI